MPIVHHIARKIDWEAALESGAYAADSLATEGFIHCSTAAQVIATANRLFKGRRDLVLLSIHTDKVVAEIHYENLEGGTELFPHIYGAIPVAAIACVHDFPARPDGTFSMPVLRI
jgi:uncharacterized protein (DUF952 family)